jgi:MFS family permease
MIGLLIGGVLWGTIGDKKGRLSVLFGSIALYSVANFLTGYVQTVNQYATARFIAGIGLAGELGAGITLVSELLPKTKEVLAHHWLLALDYLELYLLIIHFNLPMKIGDCAIKLVVAWALVYCY